MTRTKKELKAENKQLIEKNLWLLLEKKQNV